MLELCLCFQPLACMRFVKHPSSTFVAVVGWHASVINVCANSLEIASLSGEACVELLIASEVPERDSEKNYLEYEMWVHPQRKQDMLICHRYGYKTLTAADNGRSNA